MLGMPESLEEALEFIDQLPSLKGASHALIFKEFERGDWVVFDTSKPYCRLLPPCLMKFIQIEDGDAVVESQGRWSLVQPGCV